ncbi:MAG: F0F1 ATP synthase subunit epsilon, partial [Elusimicrobia bacterium]|nr:F0F1 ATP synthase subunit epsilon [Elusimicrobiota bacterium]
MNTFPLEIVTPEKVALRAAVEFLVVPAYEGELGILPGHAPLLAQLQPGVLRITQVGAVTPFAISGGFVEVTPRRVAVFAETAEMAEEIDVERARLAAERARAQLAAKAGEEVDIAQAQAALRRAL